MKNNASQHVLTEDVSTQGTSTMSTPDEGNEGKKMTEVEKSVPAVTTATPADQHETSLEDPNALKASLIKEEEDHRPVVISVQNVCKNFKLPTERSNTLKNAVVNWAKGVRGYKIHTVLKDISFEIRKGDFYGICGRNGSGKSTLLKLISGIYVPDSGTVDVNGTLVSFIELGVGFNPELTGRQNVYLNGALLGFSHEEIDAMYDEIVQFSELEEFMDQKLKNYSSGMQVRLAFSVAIKARGDILVLDEVLAVGDEDFQRKCDTFFTNIKKDPTKTIVLVTHSMGAVKKYCNRALLIEDGVIIASGDKDEVADRYTLENLNSAKRKEVAKNGDEKDKKDVKEYPLGLNEIVPEFQVTPHSPLVVSPRDEFKFSLDFVTTADKEYYVAISLLDVKRGGITYDRGKKELPVGKGPGKYHIDFHLPLSIFNSGDFRIVAAVREPEDDPESLETKLIAFTNDDNSCFFSVREPDNEGYALLNDSAIMIYQDKIAKEEITPAEIEKSEDESLEQAQEKLDKKMKQMHKGHYNTIDTPVAQSQNGFEKQ